MNPIIKLVTPLAGYRLLMELETGSSITVDLSEKLFTARFAELRDEEIFRNVETDGNKIIWGGNVLKIQAEDLISLAVTGR